jgi:Bacterial Ig-like domain (group 3)
MKPLFRPVAGAGLLALVVGFLTLGVAGVASAATPPWQTSPPAQEVGGLLFFNAAGQQITGGSITTAPFAAYVEGTTVLNASDSKATLFAVTPVDGQAPGQWNKQQLGAAEAYPNNGAPGALATAAPLYSGSTNDISLETYSTTYYPNTDTSSDGYAGLYEIRLISSDPTTTTTYDAADISINTSTDTWSVVYPAPTLTSTTTTLTANPASPQVSGSSVTLTATVSPAAPGTVQFEAGGTDIGSPVTVSGGSASTSWTADPVSTISLSAVFTPAQFSAYSGSTGTLPYTVGPAPAANTTTALTVNPSTAAADTAVTLTANVTSGGSALSSGAGTVYFYDNGSSTNDSVSTASTLLGTSPLGTGGTASLTYSSFAEGTHNLVVEFEPENTAVYNSSTSPVALFAATAPTYTPDQQGVSVSIPAGTLTITTPYTSATPFNLSTATLNAGGGYFSATAPFGSDTLPSPGQTYQGITITDTGIGEQPWTASVTATNFSGPDSDTINAQNLSFTGVEPLYISGNQYAASGGIPVNTSAVTSDTWNAGTGPTGDVYSATASGSDGLAGGPHQFADTASAGGGSVYIYGNLNLVAPSSVTPGLYTATLTFTVS